MGIMHLALWMCMLPVCQLTCVKVSPVRVGLHQKLFQCTSELNGEGMGSSQEEV